VVTIERGQCLQMSLLNNILLEFQLLGLTPTVNTLQDLWNWIRKTTLIPERMRFEHQSLVGVSLRFNDIVEAMSGSFGKVYLAYKQVDDTGQYVFLKSSPKHQASLLVEGLLQSIAHVTLKQYAFPNAVPRVLHFIEHPEFGSTLVLERIPRAQLFSDYLKSNFLWETPCYENDMIFLNVIIQVASYIAILETVLGMNHRDLKGTNVLMVAPVDLYSKTIVLKSHSWKFKSHLEISIIDFGFTCIGKGKQILSAGDFISETDFCPKEGRDMFLFLSSLWNVELFRKSLTPKIVGLFERWLTVSNKNWASWLSTPPEKNMMSVYLLTSGNLFRSPSCSPLAILKDISSIAPSLLEFNVT
jgi:serine/threonine protein kinase